MKTTKKILIAQTATSIVFVLHYLFIGATSACVLNIVSAVRNIVYYFKNKYPDKKIFASNLYPVIFAVIMAVLGALSWQGMFSLFVIVGLVINTVCMSLKNPQNMRKSILVTSPLVLIYDVWVFSIGGIIYESIAILSSVIGLIRYYKQKQEG